MTLRLYVPNHRGGLWLYIEPSGALRTKGAACNRFWGWWVRIGVVLRRDRRSTGRQENEGDQT